MAIIRTNGFVQLRRGLIEHVINQQMTPTEFTVYVMLLVHADPATGMWRGCSETIAQIYGIPTRTCRDIFNRLERNKYIRRFQVPGRRGIYPLLINRFECTDGAMKGMRLNAFKSESYDKLFFEECRDDAGTVPGECRDGAGTVPVYREEEKKKLGKVEKKTIAIQLPEWIPKEPWDRFIEWRLAKGKVTPGVIKTTIDALEKLVGQGHEPGAVLDQSVQKGWAGVFPINGNGGNNGNRNGHKTAAIVTDVQATLLDLRSARGANSESSGSIELNARPTAGAGSANGLVPKTITIPTR